MACPAKINLALRVLDRREDGYHELDTVFQSIDLWDTLEVRPGESLKLTCEAPGVPADRSNLVFRAAEMLRAEHGRADAGAELVLRKTIPPQGGLGGGSSDAAGALLALDQLWDLRLSTARLESLAARLGADVPFFLHGGTARGMGRGDRIEALPPLRPTSFLLGLPPFGVPTPEVFADVAGQLTLPGIGVSLPRLLAHKWPVGNDFRFADNDLQTVVFKRWPVLREFREALVGAGALAALLSGSGSTVYGIFDDPERASRTAERLRTRFDTWTIIPTVSVPEGAYRR